MDADFCSTRKPSTDKNGAGNDTAVRKTGDTSVLPSLSLLLCCGALVCVNRSEKTPGNTTTSNAIYFSSQHVPIGPKTTRPMTPILLVPPLNPAPRERPPGLPHISPGRVSLSLFFLPTPPSPHVTTPLAGWRRSATADRHRPILPTVSTAPCRTRTAVVPQTQKDEANSLRHRPTPTVIPPRF